MSINIHTVHIQLASEHLLLIGWAVWAVLPKLRNLLGRKK
jgi:hypothetical protein